ncbi:LacI family DNA-binding transcriptional regulator [Actinomyces sp.]|uniref:LacI family DNA-binding transcriptional regulator n=1 Tax=Actinomyces sp. TaxID=29317 RepID=UPI0026DCC36E|nr:LacI family DNA-binding transcriptional regulator [Actinomyces sp.]MDO4900584.1 LacI family DNA-binding transcriptional regulator [Actinomyces sp.]
MPADRVPRVTIAMVAARCRRSVSTISAALNGAPGVAPHTREEILRVADEMGYEADPRARLLRRTHSGLIGACFAVGQAFQGLLVDGLYRAAADLDHALALAAVTRHRSAAEGMRALQADHCEGLILVDSEIPEEMLARAERRMPTVVVCRTTGVSGIDEVRSRDEIGIAALIDHLVATGRRRIVYLDGGAESASAARVAAYCSAMGMRGLSEMMRVVSGGADEDAGARCAAVLAEESMLPDAVMCFNDHAAVGALMELRRRGIRVPREVAVCGYDDIPVTESSAFSLTTVRQDAVLIAETAVRTLLARVHPESVAGAAQESTQEAAVVLPPGVVREPRPQGGWAYLVVPELIARDSTA